MRFLSLFFALLLASAVHADLPTPRLDRLTVLGAAAGSSVEVDLNGDNLDGPIALLFDHAGLKAELIKDHKFKISVAGDVPAGTYDVRLLARFGPSNPRLFQVSRGLAEVMEKEPNDDVATAQQIPLNSVVNGASDGNREDVYKFPLKKGQRVVIECQAQKLDSQLDASMLLMDGRGKQLASNGDYFGRDPLLDLIAPADGDYFVSVYDLSFRGGFPYRLLVTDQPHVEAVFPRALQVERPTLVTVYGRNLGPAAKPSAWKINDLPLDELTETVMAPRDLLANGAFRFSEHPTTHSVLPTAATCTLTGFQVRGCPVLLTDVPVTLETEPNDDPKKPQPIAIPAVVSGRFDRERDADWFEFTAPDTATYALDVYCERIAGRADPYLVVLDDEDHRILELDDFGVRTRAFDGHVRDPSGTMNLNAKKKYRLLVQDRYKRGGARFQYVLTVNKAKPDFYASVIHQNAAAPVGTIIRRGGAQYLDVVIHAREGFNGPVTITAEGLPPGLHADPTVVSNGSSGPFVFWADADAPDWVGPVKLFANGKRGDETIRHEVRPYSRVWLETNLNSSRPTRELILAIRETAPYNLRFTTEKIELTAGKKAEVKLLLERQWPDFKSSVNVIPLFFPDQLKMGAVTIADNQREATITLEVQANAKPGLYTIAVLGQAQAPFSKDPRTMPKPNTLVSIPSRSLTVEVRAEKK